MSSFQILVQLTEHVVHSLLFPINKISASFVCVCIYMCMYVGVCMHIRTHVCMCIYILMKDWLMMGSKFHWMYWCKVLDLFTKRHISWIITIWLIQSLKLIHYISFSLASIRFYYFSINTSTKRQFLLMITFAIQTTTTTKKNAIIHHHIHIQSYIISK